VPVLEATEALYEALSNQVVEAGNATSFMAQEMKLAITTVSSLDEAVDTTSTVLNAFRKNVAETARINAVLFKAVDVGRFRLNELGSQFGRVSVLSNELKISFEEQAAAIALLTRLGLNADVAQTLLTNVQLKLVKPTETMVELFNKWGVSSGAAAVQTFGFAGVLRKLAQEAQGSNDPMQELGEIFQDLRAITGAQGLVSNFDLFEETLREVTNSTEAFNKAFDLSMESLGRKADVEVEKVRQLLLVQFGEPFLRLMLGIADSAGGADKAIARLIKTFVIGGTVFLSYRTALNLVNSAVALHAGLTARSTAATAALTGATTAQTAATTGLTVAQGAATAGLTLLIAGLALVVIKAKTLRAEFQASLAVFRANAMEQARRDLDKLQTALGETADKQLQFTNATFRSYFLYVANMRALNTSLTEDFQKKFKKINDAMKEGLDVSTDIISDKLRELTDELEKTRKVIDDLKEGGRDKALEAEDKAFEFEVKGLSDEDALKAVVARKRELEAEALAALHRGETDLADELFKRVESLSEDAEDRVRDLVKATKDAAVEIRHHLEGDGDAAIVVKDGDAKGVIKRKGPKRKKGAGEPDIAIDVKEEVVDLERMAALEAALVTLEEERRASVAARLALERTILATKEAEARALEAEIATREKAFEDFKRLVAEIDSFDASAPGAAVNFDALVNKTEAAGKAAGLSPAEQLQFLRQAFAQRILLAREAATAAAKAQLDIEQKALQEGTRQVEKAIKDRQAAQNATAEKLNAFAIQNLEAAKRLAEELVAEGGIDNVGKVRQADTDESKAAIAEFERLNQELLETQRNGGNVQAVLDKIALSQARLAAVLAKINAEAERRVGLIPIADFDPAVERNKEGEVLFPKEAGKADESFSDVLEDSQVALQKIREEFGKAAAAQKEFEKASEVMGRLKAQAELIPAEIRKQAEAAEDAGKRSVTAQEAVNRVLNGTLVTLEAIRQKHLQIIEMRRQEAEAIEAAGPVVPRAHGGFVGRGTDRHLVALSGGEHVSNRLTTRQYGPLLRSLATQPPLFRAQGGDTNHNYGDINIHPKSGVSDGIVTEVAQKLQRLQRRGLFSLKG
jgi:TP901 family phage tail tape measure protein